MCTRFVFVIRARTSPARCCGVPLPGLLYDSLPGCPLAYWMNSAMVLYGWLLLATRMIGTEAICPTGAKSFSIWKGVFVPIAGLIVIWFEAIRMVWPSAGAFATKSV